MFLALAVALPIAFHFAASQIDLAGRVFLPMHFPVLLAGYLVGGRSGLVVGLLAPALSTVLTGMPPGDRIVPMTMELATYGAMAGLTYRQGGWNIFVSLITTMTLGRLMFGIGLVLRGLAAGLSLGEAQFYSVAMLAAGLPGVVLQLVLIPVIVKGVERKKRP
jgi:hypothetical protein